MAWHIIQASSQRERKAASEIRRQADLQGREGLRTYLPKWSWVQVNRRTGEKTVRHRPLMPGYLFARFPAGFYPDVKECEGVVRIIKSTTGAPALVPDKLIAALIRNQRDMKHEAEADRIYRMGRRRGAPSSFDAAMSSALFGNADAGMIVAGPWEGKVVTLLGIETNGLVRAEIELMGVVSAKTFKPLVEIIPVQQAAVAVDETREAA
ncbi:transcription termination/antitermination NusG family protein [Devosia sp. ZB163]|uniref:transcription termination/antitermination protein NusG n=1 Tax=Devosia sp. ZB163 TaxID=3025938 RepID=UPI00235E599E|nr:transcription termination/antitermination NusG family protein [Devosia sp. ZB163]MDC9825665.1 transcription termination/antitermination NusG family protein [Devosia sp. ZB163]